MAKMTQELTQERLKELVSYDAETGVFRRLKNTTRQRAGEVAGRARPDGYIRFRVDGKEFWAHRLAWLYVHGEWPVTVDHINRNPSDNRLANLRSVTQGQNNQNRVDPKTGNKAGLLGVSMHRQSGKWRARIAVDGASKTIGYFATPEQAQEAYWMAKKVMHPFAAV